MTQKFKINYIRKIIKCLLTKPIIIKLALFISNMKYFKITIFYLSIMNKHMHIYQIIINTENKFTMRIKVSL
jgi:hypothetical protein